MYGSVNKDACFEAMDKLSDAFSWGETPEGNAFWTAVHHRLWELSEGEKPRIHCLPNAGGALDASLKELCKKLRDEMLILQVQLAVKDDEVNALRKKLVAADFIGMGR